jgi:electron-transferring-flavoprotein dehydrogenase
MQHEHEVLSYDVVIVGAGASGLASAIHLHQLSQQHNVSLSIAILEKGSSVGAHIISGCVFDPISLTELIPNWETLGLPIDTLVSCDELHFLTSKKDFKLPRLPFLDNTGNYVISLSQLCVSLAAYAESLGIEIYPGFAATAPLIEDGRVVGILTGEVGVSKNGEHGSNYQPAVAIRAKQVILAEGCRGSVSQQIIKQFALDKDSSCQSYGLGIKEVWQINPKHFVPGKVAHYIGYPLNNNAYGGGFIYHFGDNLISIGLVTALDYQNPYLSPYQEFQRFKLHPKIKPILEGAVREEYGARAVTEGGVQALPKLSFPGGVLVGDSAGFLNVPKIKGVHNAIKSGMIAADTIFTALLAKEGEAADYSRNLRQSWLYQDLYGIRNIRPAFRFGLYLGMAYTLFEHYILRNKAPWTFKLRKKDNERLQHKSKFMPLEYPAPDGVVSFDIASSLHLSNIHHEDNQPCHLHLKDRINLPIEKNLLDYAFPEKAYCPAEVYVLIKDHDKRPLLQINSQNCLHCKACDIKDPTQNITWTPPESGSGPQYSLL